MYRSYLFKLNYLLFLFLSCSILHSRAQSSDSLTVVNKEWTVKKVAKGVEWKQGHFDNLFNSVQEVNWIEIDLKKQGKNLHLAADSKILKPTSEFALENNALVAINGGFFNMKDGGAVDYIRVDGQVINQTAKESDRANAVLSIDRKRVTIQPATRENVEDYQSRNLMLSGPLLLQSANRYNLGKNAFNDNRHPRTAVGIAPKNKLILLVVDGRNAQAQGMSLHELASLMKWIGAQDAMNLDGGGSSTLFVKGGSPNDIVNYPSDNKKFDHEGQRNVANIIYLKN